MYVCVCMYIHIYIYIYTYINTYTYVMMIIYKLRGPDRRPASGVIIIITMNNHGCTNLPEAIPTRTL